MSDIVERLRATADEFQPQDWSCDICTEAAAEIERLREQVYAVPPTENTAGQTWKEACGANRDEVARLDSMLRTYRLPDEVVDIKVVIELRAEIERLRGRLKPSIDYADGIPAGYGEDEIDRQQAEIERLRAEVDLRAKQLQTHIVALLNAEDEIERLRKQITQRGARMQVMHEWMMPNDWQHFVVTRPGAAAWFDEKGVPR